MATTHLPLCGCFYLIPSAHQYNTQEKYLPQVGLSSHTTVLSATSKTVLTQTFLNPSKSEKLDQVQYAFPLYDGVSVVGFQCTVAERVIVGVVKERQQARKDYKEAVERGETAGLFEQHWDAADCFTTRVGNVPAGGKVVVEITYVGELKNDAETDGIRFTIPTVIAPRYGSLSDEVAGLPDDTRAAIDKAGMSIVVDIAVEAGVIIRTVQSPSHPIAMTMGRTSTMPDEAFDNQHASVTLTMGSTELGKDFIVVITTKGHDSPAVLLEHHPTLPNHRALMATLVPKFNLPSIRPEIVFVADRSGSMEGKITTLVSALKIFLKSLPLGVKFNICSFGSRHEFLWSKSKTYDQSSLNAALKHLEYFRADLGGTEILRPIEDVVRKRYQDMHLEVIVVTDGEIWNQKELFDYINEATTKSVRFFSLGIGSGASSSLVEGIGRAGDGFAQLVGENEKMEKKVVRMLKGAVTPHIRDYTMEVTYEKADEQFEIVESVEKSLQGVQISSEIPAPKEGKAVISLFDSSAKMEDEIVGNAGKYDHLPITQTPRLLQAPARIPPLYPFNRSTVYLLMSAHSCQHAPKAVVLRATSEHGPLELEIPVQDIGTGETLHKLAARKAIHELEEGRGWITEAKDHDGKLIKTKFEGRWDEMVEREGVRLGVQFQVGSKWCSFVAVEKGATTPVEGLAGYDIVEKRKVEELRFCDSSQNSYHSSMSQRVVSQLQQRVLQPQQGLYQQQQRFSQPQQGFYQQPQGFYQQQQQQEQQSVHMMQAPFAPPQTVSFFGGSAQPLSSGVVKFNRPTKRRSDNGDGSNNAPAPAFAPNTLYAASAAQGGPLPPRSPKLWSKPPVDRRARLNNPGRPQGVLPSATEEIGDLIASNKESFTDEEMTEYETKEAADRPLATTDEERMHQLIALQEFDGRWKWIARLFAAIGLEEDKVKALISGHGFQNNDDVAATMLAVAFLEFRVAQEEGVWEMVVDKARGWLGGKGWEEEKLLSFLTLLKESVRPVG